MGLVLGKKSVRKGGASQKGLISYFLCSQPVVLHLYPTWPNNSLTGTPVKAIRKPTCMLPMLDSAHTRDRAFEMVSIVFCVDATIILLSSPSQIDIGI